MKYHIILTAVAAWLGMNTIAFAQEQPAKPATCEYRFDHDFNSRSSSSIPADDNVFFGIQAFDNAGHATSAILSDTFAIKVNVQPEFINLENNVPAEFQRPATGHIQGFKFESESNDSLLFTVDRTCKFDIYASDGKNHLCSTL